jgi:hypothetical protein
MAYGTVSADLIQTSTGQSLGAGNSVSMVNRIINSRMEIDQRNAGASVTVPSGNVFITDRFQILTSQASKLTAQQNQGAVTPPVGFSNYLGMTSSSAYSVGAADYFTLQQPVEGFNIADLGWGTANAKTVTMSFWVRSSLTGTFGGAIYNSDANRSYPFTYTITSAKTWEYETITIAGDTSGTWLTNNGVGMRINWGLGVGSTPSGTAGAWASALYRSATGATSVVGTNGATFYITGVDLRLGEYATAPSPDFRSYQQELALCQRYYWQTNRETSFAGLGSGVMNTATVARIFIPYPVSMRAAPTISATSVDLLIVSQGSDVNPNSFTPYANSKTCMVDLATGTGTLGRGAVLLFGDTGSPSIQATAEL